MKNEVISRAVTSIVGGFKGVEALSFQFDFEDFDQPGSFTSEAHVFTRIGGMELMLEADSKGRLQLHEDMAAGEADDPDLDDERLVGRNDLLNAFERSDQDPSVLLQIEGAAQSAYWQARQSLNIH